MGTTSEDYLDSLLRAAMEPVKKEETEESAPVVDEVPVIEAPVIETPVIEEPIVEESIIEETVTEEPVVVVEESIIEEDNPNKQLSADEIAAMFAAADTSAESMIETAPEIETEPEIEAAPVVEENPLSVDEIDAMIAALDEEPVAEETVVKMPAMAETKVQENPVVAPVDDNPNRQLSADEIAAMFAAADTPAEPMVEPEVETEAEPVVEENPLSVDEIDAMIAALDEEPVVEEVSENPVVTPVDDNPNRQLSADEIAAMFAAADTSADTVADSLADVTEEPTVEDTVTEEESSLDDLLALSDTEEMEIDLDNVDDLDALLGLREIPAEHHWDEETGQMVEGSAPEVDETDELAQLASADSDDMGDLADLLAMTGSDSDELASLSAMAGTEDMENQDLSDLLSMLGDDDGDLAEINDLLQKSDNNEIVEDDEMLAMLGGLGATGAETGSDSSQEVSELLAEDTAEEKPKKKLWGRKKKEKAEKKAASVPEENATPAEEGAPKEKGFFGKLFDALTEEVEDEEDLLEAAIEGEGLPIDKKSKNKKKKDKKNKGKKAASNDEILEEMDEEDAANAKGKGKKKGGKGGKKPGKPKKEKNAKIPEIEEPGKKLPKKMIIRIFVLCFSLLAVLVLVTVLLPQLLQLSDARKDFYNGNYEEAYQGLAGQDLNESDQILLKKAEILAQLNRKADAYTTYNAVGKKAEALNELFEGVAYYWEYDEKFDELGIRDEANSAYAGILILLQDDYNIDEDRAREIVAMDSIAYTYEVRNLASGKITVREEATEIENGEEEPAEPLEDMLEDEQ